MQSVSGLMSGYFSSSGGGLLVERSDLPIEITKNEWSVLKDPERMHRVYDFKGRPGALRFFVEELLEYQEKLGHHSEISHCISIRQRSKKENSSFLPLGLKAIHLKL